MATVKKASGSKSPRELITPHEGNSRYQRRGAGGKFAEGDKVSRSQPADKAQKAKTVARPGHGDEGDHLKRAKKGANP